MPQPDNEHVGAITKAGPVWHAEVDNGQHQTLSVTSARTSPPGSAPARARCRGLRRHRFHRRAKPHTTVLRRRCGLPDLGCGRPGMRRTAIHDHKVPRKGFTSRPGGIPLLRRVSQVRILPGHREEGRPRRGFPPRPALRRFRGRATGGPLPARRILLDRSLWSKLRIRRWPCPSRARSSGEPRGTPGSHVTRTQERSPTDNPGQGPFSGRAAWTGPRPCHRWTPSRWTTEQACARQ